MFNTIIQAAGMIICGVFCVRDIIFDDLLKKQIQGYQTIEYKNDVEQKVSDIYLWHSTAYSIIPAYVYGNEEDDIYTYGDTKWKIVKVDAPKYELKGKINLIKYLKKIYYRY